MENVGYLIHALIIGALIRPRGVRGSCRASRDPRRTPSRSYARRSRGLTTVSTEESKTRYPTNRKSAASEARTEISVNGPYRHRYP